MEIIDLEGDPRARGVARGVAQGAPIHACMADWLDSLRASGLGDPAGYLASMLQASEFAAAVSDLVPDLLEEARGMALGANIPFDLLLAAQLMDEEWAYRSSRQPGLEPLQKCSSVAIRRSDGVLVGQNMDLGGYTDGHQAVVRIAPHREKPGALIFTLSSMIALMGVNDRRIAVCVNSLPQLPANRQGLPVAFMIRKVLQAESLPVAVETVRKMPHATGQHYLIADAEAIRSFEASPAGVVEYAPTEPSRVFHTNHPLAERPVGAGEANHNSVMRLRSLVTRLGAGKPDLEDVKAALSSSDDPEHPVSRVSAPSARPSRLTGMISFTTGSMISALRRDAAVESWISAGPPSLHPYARYSLPS
jgi:isopenicillin-N N-acyltransferase like protein